MGKIMVHHRPLIIVGAAVVALGTTGASVAGAASPAVSASHSLKFNSVQTSEKRFGTHFIDADKDVKNGKQIGSDVVDGTYDPKTQTFRLSIACGLEGGLLYASGTGQGSTGKFSGKVTGGTGAYKGITGTLKGTSYGKHDDNEHLTITYHG